MLLVEGVGYLVVDAQQLRARDTDGLEEAFDLALHLLRLEGPCLGLQRGVAVGDVGLANSYARRDGNALEYALMQRHLPTM